MYLYKKDAKKILSQMSRGVVSELKGKFNFLLSLLKEDGWSFIVKSHAMIEAAMTQMLTQHLGHDQIKSIIERLPLSGNSTGKLAIAKELGLLSEKHIKFIRWLSELRNKLVHRIENVNFSFKKHMEAFDPNQRAAWIQSIIWFAGDAESRSQWRKISVEHPKVVLFKGIVLVVSECVITTHHAKSIRQSQLAAEKATAKYLRSTKRITQEVISLLKETEKYNKVAHKTRRSQRTSHQ